MEKSSPKFVKTKNEKIKFWQIIMKNFEQIINIPRYKIIKTSDFDDKVLKAQRIQ